MQVTQAPRFIPTSSIRTQTTPAPQGGGPTGGGEPPQQEKVSIGKEALRTAISWGNATGTVTGGATAIATSIGGLYMGVLGGAIVGGMLGGGLGPVFGALSSHGAMDFLSTSFHTMGVAAKAGVVLGGLSGAAGSWSVGQSIGELGGKAAGFVPGAVAGAVGALGKKANEIATGENGGDAVNPNAPQPKPHAHPITDLNQMSGVGKTLAAGVGGFGLLAGAAGGFVAGAGVASTHSLVSGLLVHNVTLANLTGAAMVGGGVGAAAMGVLGAVGGWKLVKAGQGLYNKVHDQVGK